MLTLHANPLSAWTLKVQYFLEETGIPYKYQLVDLKAGEQTRAPYLAINPFGVVPAIEEDGFSMGESSAILRYLAQKHQKFDWYPQNLEDRARVDHVAEFANLHLNRWLTAAAWELHYAPKLMGATPKMDIVRMAHDNLAKNFVKLERTLSGRRYLCGPTPTLADATLLPFAAAAPTAQVSLRDYPRVAQWLELTSQRPAWRKVMAEFEKVAGALR